MLNLTVAQRTGAPLHVLCLGSHADDLEIGCGGTIRRLISGHKHVHVQWVVLSGNHERAAEARAGAASFLEGADHEVEVATFRDGFFPYVGGEVKDYFEDLRRRCAPPDLIFTHYRDDRHQDHRVVSELTWNTFRDHMILEYEIPKYDGDLGTPNLFVHLDAVTSQRKAREIVRIFKTQHGRHWFTEDLFLSLLRLRGMESAAPAGYAEAFYARKVVTGF